MKTFRCMANQGDDDDSIVKHKLATTAVREQVMTNILNPYADRDIIRISEVFVLRRIHGAAFVTYEKLPTCRVQTNVHLSDGDQLAMLDVFPLRRIDLFKGDVILKGVAMFGKYGSQNVFLIGCMTAVEHCIFHCKSERCHFIPKSSNESQAGCWLVRTAGYAAHRGSSVTYKIARSRATLLSNYPVRIQIILRDRGIIRMKSVHSRFREHMARKIRKHALPGDIACCHGPGIKALNCCEGGTIMAKIWGQGGKIMAKIWVQGGKIMAKIWGQGGKIMAKI
eukprot:Em0008g258a